MPIDPMIPLSTRGVGQLIGYGDLVEQTERARAQREQRDALAEQRRMLAAQREQQTAAITEANADKAATGSALQAGGGVRAQTLAWAQQNRPTIVPTLTKYFDEADTRSTAILKARHELQTQESELFGDLADGALQHGATPEALQTALAYVTERFPEYKEHADQVWQSASKDPAAIKTVLEQIRDMAPSRRVKPTAPHVVGQALVSSDGKVLYQGAEKVTKPASAQEYEYAQSQGYKGTYQEYQNEDANRRRPVVNVNAGGGTGDIKEAVAGMKDGTLPPQLPGRASKDYTATLAEAHRQGYDLAAAVTDWNATQKHIATMNGAQQLRLNQAVNALPEMLDSVEALAKQWKGGKFPLLNSVTMKAAKGGLYGPDAASIANRLDAQIADVTADLGNVYMGGNSPTDHALQLAGKSLNSNWDEKVLLDMIGLARKNVSIRQNSIRHTGVSGASEHNPYAPQSGQQAAPAGDGRIRVKGPNGETGTMPANSALPPGWSKAGG